MFAGLESQDFHPQGLKPDSLCVEYLPHFTTSAIGPCAPDLHAPASHTFFTLSASQDPDPIADEEDNKKLFKEWQQLRTNIRSTGQYCHEFLFTETRHLISASSRLFTIH